MMQSCVSIRQDKSCCMLAHIVTVYCCLLAPIMMAPCIFRSIVLACAAWDSSKRASLLTHVGAPAEHYWSWHAICSSVHRFCQLLSSSVKKKPVFKFDLPIKPKQSLFSRNVMIELIYSFTHSTSTITRTTRNSQTLTKFYICGIREVI